jgi:hypothetical protein
MVYAGGPDTTDRDTGQERDNETGLDFFQARYCSGHRLTSLDPRNAGGDPSDTQTWNGYAAGPRRWI